MNILDTLIGDKLKQFAQLKTDVIFKKIMDNPTNQQIVLDFIRRDQLYKKGVDENDEIIGLYTAYTQHRNPEKREGTPYTLIDSGEFYGSMNIEVSNLDILIDADPIKTDWKGKKTNLFKKFGDGIIGLNQESKEKYKVLLKTKIQGEIRKLLR